MQTCTINGKFNKKANKNSQQLIDDNSTDALVKEFFDENEDWGDDDDSKIPKSTYYNKYGPSGSLTKAAAGTKKITNFFNNSDTQATDLQLFNQDILNDILSDTDSSDLESDIACPLIEYNYKRAIFEYLTLLNNNNGHGKVDINLKVVQKIYIDATFKKFVKNELFPAIGIAREKSITIMTATRFQQPKNNNGQGLCSSVHVPSPKEIEQTANSMPNKSNKQWQQSWTVIGKTKQFQLFFSLDIIPGQNATEKKNYVYQIISDIPGLRIYVVTTIKGIKVIKTAYDSEESAQKVLGRQI
ncbi:hypothetical protein C1646_773324 [Rhizophagus diaphanus]|nr:hypothetical protein C1646_773324 [Rhizophagus diaphanus] [Rhizophagus sp. MUCL 43196]